VAISVQGYNVTVQNNVIFNTQDGIDFSYSFPATSNLTVVGNSIMGFNHGIQVATSDYQIAPLFYNAIIRSNRIDGMDYYESTNPAVGDGYHMDPIFLFNTSVNTNNYTPTNDPCSYYIGCISNVDISCNFIGPGVNPQTSAAGSAGIFIHDYSTNQMDHVLIYNNILVLKPPLTYGDGFIDGGYAVNSIIANNTLIGWATNLPSGGALAGLVTNTNASSQMIFCGYPYGTGLSACGGYSVFNNVLYNMTSQIMFQGQPSTNNLSTFTTNELSYLSGLFSDYNIYQMGIVPRMRFYAESTFSFGTGPTYQGGNSIGIGRDFLPDWQALGPQFDQHSSTNVPLLDPVTYAPLSSDTVAHGQGTNLSAYFTTDFYGNPRPGGTNSWDIGALTAKAPYVAAPTGLHVIPAN
jgi:hypothetical protein